MPKNEKMLSEAVFLKEQVYQDICAALMRGDFIPGQKITIRNLASVAGTSLTPVRDALNRLVAENVLQGEANRSVIVPTLSGEQIRQLRDIRVLNETFATRIAASKATRQQVSGLRRIAVRLKEARAHGNRETDLKAIHEFQFAVYEISEMPLLINIIRSLWLQSGPYLQVLFPDYIKELENSVGNWRERLCDALAAKDIDAACQEIERDISGAMTYVAHIADAARSYRQTKRS